MPFIQDVDARLTLTRVATAPALIAEVAQLSGQHLEVSPSLGTEVLMVSVEKAPVWEVLTKVAIAATATWQPVEGGYRLVADSGARGIEAGRERALRLQAINDGLKKKQEALAKATKEDPDGGAAIAGAFLGQGSIDSFIPMLDLAAIANMQSGDRLVFATNPNAAQRPLRGNATGLVTKWVSDHNKTASAMGGASDEIPEEMKAFMQGPIGDRFKRMSKPVTATPVKVIVAVSQGANPLFGDLGLGVRIEARAYDAKGMVLLEESGSLDTSMLAMLAQLGAKKPAAAGNTTPIEYSADAKSFLESSAFENPMMSGSMMGGLKLLPSLRKLLFSPDKFDPLALVPGEGLAALSKARRKPLVACIPDAAYPGMVTNQAPKTVEEVEESLRTGPMRLVPDSTYFVVKPAEPDTARRVRLDRNALTDLLRAISDHETPSLDELSTYALKSVAPAQNAISMSFLTKFAPATMGSMSGMISWDALRLFGSLSPAQRQSLADGARIPFSTVSPAGQNALRSMLYGANGNLTAERAGVSTGPDIFSSVMKMMMGGGGIDVRDEPTEVAPRGLPNNGYLQATVTTDSIIRPVSTDGEIFYSLGTDELAMFHLMSSGPMAEAIGDQMKLPENGRLGSRTQWDLRGYVAEGTYVGSALTDDRTPKDGQHVSLSNMPANLKSKVDAKVEQLKKSPFGAILSMGAFARPQARP